MEPAIKIFTLNQWQGFQADGVFNGSDDDKRDGFIHLSYADQLFGTVSKWFDGENAVVLAVFTPLETDLLKAEESRGGALFPHYYGVLTLAEMGLPVTVERREDGYSEADVAAALTALGIG